LGECGYWGEAALSITAQEAAGILSQKFLLEEGISGVSHHSQQLVVYVESPEVAERVPRSLMGFPVKVTISGRFKALSLLQETLPEAKSGRTITGLEASRTAKWRPSPGGVSVGHYLITAGTLATRVYDVATGRKLFLSNNHVLAATNRGRPGDPILQPAPYDKGKLPDDQLGVLERFIELKPPPDTNLVDASLGRPLREEDLSDEVLDIGVITGWEEPTVGMRVAKSGRSCGYAEATVEDVNASIKVYYGMEEYYVFEDQIITSYLAAPGDSGSICINVASKRAVGLLFAGSNTLTVLNKMRHVTSLLGITFTPPTITLPGWWPPLALALGFAPVGLVTTVIGGQELRKFGVV
jgi:hypothetical protein